MTARLRNPLLLVLALAGSLALASCGGPRPVITEQQLIPPQQEGQPYILSVLIHNAGSGEGQVTVEARVFGPNHQIAASEEDHTVALKPHETERLTIEVQPAIPGPYTAEVEASYPP